MKQIAQLYGNDFGMSFYWTKDDNIIRQKVQLVFKETGFYFSVEELKVFIDLIKESASKNSCCKDCEMKSRCHKFLLKTPCVQVDLAVSMNELNAIEDLVKGTLFKINMHEFLNGEGRN